MNRISKTLYQTLPPWMRHQVTRVLQPLGADTVSATATLSSLLEDSYPARVVQLQQETPRAVSLTFELLEGYRLNYRSGQFVTVSVAVGGVLFQRCYSFSSAPDENRYTITVKRSFQGRLSRYLTESLKVGDQIYVSAPDGEFVLTGSRPAEQRYVMVAGGSGIVPVFSLIKDLLGKNPDADIQLVYSSRTTDTCIFRKELERLEKLHPGFSLRFQFTRKDGDMHDASRRLDGQKILSRLADPASAVFYLCAPNGLVKKCIEAFREAGIPETRIRLELFNRPPATSVQTELKPRLVTFLSAGLLGKARHVRQRQVETVLDTARNAGLDIPQKCTVGNCKTCKLRIRSGSVIMDEPNVLSVDEAKEGYILSCVSYPCENLVVQLPGR